MKDAIISWILSENECIQHVNFRSNLLDLSACYARLLQHLNTLIHFYEEVNRYTVAYTMVSILDTAGLEKLQLNAHKAGSSELAKKNIFSHWSFCSTPSVRRYCFARKGIGPGGLFIVIHKARSS